MIVRELAPNVYAFVAQDWDRKLFDELVPLPEGTSYNAYLVRGSERTALIDTVHPSMAADFVQALKSLGLARLDYIVSNHAELDHAGAIPAVLAAYPEAKVLANAKCRSLLAASLDLPKEMFGLIQDNHTLSLGDQSLRFMWIPWVHWPDSTATLLEPDNILFSCDFMGAHLATSDLFADDEARVERAARMYYAEIMMPYRKHVTKHLDRLATERIAMIAPSHGPVYARPAFILDLYRRWAGDTPQAEVVIPYLSMYDSTRNMVGYLLDRLMEQGWKVQPFNTVDLDSGRFASALVEASTLVFASPTVLDGPHPAMASAALLVNALKPKATRAGIIGSYGWGTSMPDNLRPLLGNLDVTWFAPVIASGVPKAEDFAALDRLVGEIGQADRPAGD
ncbi:MAG: FprA family A-type flavoprotein [Paludibacterium sp.]|uniref:FprA family A-type flavoprotein n=1 Tax=Paludibacterium sp. TaxID=1917523 RepID=UPI0025FB0C1A|nr:FprA family A-type flavoprotein [Paludibacterium sp.]MBV8046289.1 FprA family A-type flavoprotein [Paludibacterium sp.]MBV8647712.1 FprA family A-type flavoprotein [Paludibacterium sp.]